MSRDLSFLNKKGDSAPFGLVCLYTGTNIVKKKNLDVNLDIHKAFTVFFFLTVFFCQVFLEILKGVGGDLQS